MSNFRMTRVLLFATLAGAVPAAAQDRTTPDGEVRAVAQAFQRALASGDSTAALALLHADVRIFESGRGESRDQYRAGHLRADIAFLREVRSETTSESVTVRGDLALYRREYTVKGRYRDRDVDRTGTETMVLLRTDNTWRILHIHW